MQVGVVGLGKMGTALGRHLLGQGVAVVVWNRSKAPVDALVSQGAVAAGDASGVWPGSAAVCTFLGDDAATDAVLASERGLLAAAPGGAVLIEHSTISPEASARVAVAAAAAGVRYLRCPVSGNPDMLSAGKLALMVSGDEADVAAARPVLGRIGASVTYVGPGERARVIKLAVNSMVAGTAQLLAEVVVLAEAWGVDRATLLGMLGRSAIASPFITYKAPVLTERDYEASFTLSMLLKDLMLARAVSESASVPMPVTALVEGLVREGCAEGLGEMDMMALVPHLQHQAGVETDVEAPFGG